MRLPRVYTDQPLHLHLQLQLEGGASRHLAQVLRLKAGAEVILFDGDGRDYQARLLETGRRNVRVEITGRGDEEPPPLLRIHLGLGISRGERMDFSIQKAVELGVSRITPLLTERCEVRLPAERMQKRLKHWQGVVIAACEQSGRRRLPSLGPTRDLEQWSADNSDGYGIILDHRAPDTLDRLPPPDREVKLLIGPEGGWSGREREWMLAAGFRGARLGPRILRSETAPLAAIAAMQMLWGDFR
jgi:16S rRNA (uracil1498-N3)-methyltransferase